MLPDRLPLFPLGIVLYPDEPVPLHIFEPRYREMVRACQDEDRPFGVVYRDEGEMASVGCSARIRRVLARYDDGRLDILAMGEDRFRIVEVFRDQPYLTAEVEAFGNGGPADQPGLGARERMITQHMKLLELAGEPIRPALYQHARYASFAVAPSAGLEPEQKQRLLEMASERERVAFLIAHFEGMLRRLERARRYRRIARGDGHAGPPPEPPESPEPPA